MTTAPSLIPTLLPEESAINGNYALGNERSQREVEVALGRRVKRGQSGRLRKSPDKDETHGELL